MQHGSPSRWSRGSTRVAGLGLFTGVTVLAAMLAATTTAPAQPRAQTPATNVASIKVTLNSAGQIPNGLTGYRVDMLCSGVAGLPAPGTQTLVAALPIQGGSVTVPVAVQAGTNCAFRLVALGTGPRPINGNAAYVGGVQRAVSFPSTVNGAAVDPFTVIETVAVPIEASTDVVFGSLTPVATSTSAAPTTLLAPSSTRPAATIPVTVAITVAITAPPATVAPVVHVLPPPKYVVVTVTRDKKCRTGYRFSKGKCLTAAQLKKYVRAVTASAPAPDQVLSPPIHPAVSI